MPSVDFVKRNLLVVRETDVGSDVEDGQERMIDLALVFLGLVFIGLVATSALYLIRRRRMQREFHDETLPMYQDDKRSLNHRGLTIETKHNGRSSVFVIGRDGQPMLQNPRSPPHSPDNVPQIRITFPDEHDERGQVQRGQVLIVRVGDNATVGLEPVRDEQLPAYEKDSKKDFFSVDMDQVGGLQEKNNSRFQ
jgi:hypothetical protein